MGWSRNMDWSKFYEKIDDIQAYLSRIGQKKKYPSKKYLDELIYAHQCTIPYENLDVTDYHVPISLQPKDLFEKIIVRKRGGYCFELNGLFCQLLVSLGFDAFLCPCRTLRHSEPVPVPATHCAILVRMENQLLFCDVGYGGPMVTGSLYLKAVLEQSVHNETYYFKQEMSSWYTLIRKSTRNNEQERLLIKVAPIECLLVDFYAPNLIRSEGDTAFAVRNVSIRRQNGYASFIGNKFTEVSAIECKHFTVKEEKVEELLHHYFGLNLKHK